LANSIVKGYTGLAFSVRPLDKLQESYRYNLEVNYQFSGSRYQAVFLTLTYRKLGSWLPKPQ